jgi:hypothetical protein
MAAAGCLAGIFFKLRWIAIAIVVLFLVCLAGLLLNISLVGGETLTWIFGLGAMAVQLAGALAFGGAVISGALVRGKHPLAKCVSTKKNTIEL